MKLSGLVVKVGLCIGAHICVSMCLHVLTAVYFFSRRLFLYIGSGGHFFQLERRSAHGRSDVRNERHVIRKLQVTGSV